MVMKLKIIFFIFLINTLLTSLVLGQTDFTRQHSQMRERSDYWVKKTMKSHVNVNTVDTKKISLITGKIDSLFNENLINVEFDYGDISVVTKQSSSLKTRVAEEKYVAEKVEKLNKREEGMGDKWKAE